MGKVSLRTGHDVLYFASPSDAAIYKLALGQHDTMARRIESLEQKVNSLQSQLASTVASDAKDVANTKRKKHKLPRLGSHDNTDMLDISDIALQSCNQSCTSCIFDQTDDFTGPDLSFDNDPAKGDTTSSDLGELTNDDDSQLRLPCPCCPTSQSGTQPVDDQHRTMPMPMSFPAAVGPSLQSGPSQSVDATQGGCCIDDDKHRTMPMSFPAAEDPPPQSGLSLSSVTKLPDTELLDTDLHNTVEYKLNRWGVPTMRGTKKKKKKRPG